MDEITRPSVDAEPEVLLTEADLPATAAFKNLPETSDNTAALQQILNNAYTSSIAALIPNGIHTVSNPSGPALELNLSQLVAEPASELKRPNILGSGMGTTVLRGLSWNQYAMKILGAAGIAAHQYITIGDMSFTGAVSGHGLHIKDSAFIRGQNLGFFANNTGLNLESVLSAEFSHVHAAWCNVGMALGTGSGFSGVNAMKFTKHTYQACANHAVLGGAIQTNVMFDSCNFEGCGTHGSQWLGGVALTFNASQGCVGATFEGCYFEGNKGAYDVQLNNLGTEYMTHVFTGCNFARLHANAYATHMIRSFGKNRIVLIGCSFDRYGDYLPNPAHSYFRDMTGNAEVTCIGCKFTDASEQGGLSNI